MLTKTHAPAPFLLLARSSGQSSAEPRRFGKLATAFATLAVFVFVPATASAQQAAPAHQAGHNVALIDVAHIFKNLASIKVQVSKVESDLQKYDAELKQKRESLIQSAAQLKTLKSGTVDYARQEEQIANLESKLRLEMARKQKELADAEAKIYYDNYQRIAGAVNAIATHNNIKLVLRFNSEDMDSEQSDSVARGVMKNVVYHDSSIDITSTVMRYLDQQSNGSQVATGGRAASATNR